MNKKAFQTDWQKHTTDSIIFIEITTPFIPDAQDYSFIQMFSKKEKITVKLQPAHHFLNPNHHSFDISMLHMLVHRSSLSLTTIYGSLLCCSVAVFTESAEAISCFRFEGPTLTFCAVNHIIAVSDITETCENKASHQGSIYFQNEEISVQLNEIGQLDRITHT